MYDKDRVPHKLSFTKTTTKGRRACSFASILILIILSGKVAGNLQDEEKKQVCFIYGNCGNKKPYKNLDEGFAVSALLQITLSLSFI